MGASGDRKTARRAAPSRSRVACALIAAALLPAIVLEEVLVEMLERRRREAAPITPTADRAYRSYFLDMPGAGSSGPYQAGDDL